MISDDLKFNIIFAKLDEMNTKCNILSNTRNHVNGHIQNSNRSTKNHNENSNSTKKQIQ